MAQIYSSPFEGDTEEEQRRQASPQQPAQPAQPPQRSIEYATATPAQPTPQQGGAQGDIRAQQPGETIEYAQTPAPAAPNTSTWNTDGYATPGYTATNYGNAPSGFDQTKFQDQSHQTPKYVVGRILQEASGGTGRVTDPAARQAAIDKIVQAYPGTTFNGKDKVNIPGVGSVDIFGGAGAGTYSVAWMPDEPGGGAAPGQPGAGQPPPSGGFAPNISTLPGGPAPGGSGAGNDGLGTRDPQWQALYDELVKRSQQGLDVDPNDPVIKGQVDAANVVANRNRLTQMQAAAERSGPYASGKLANEARASGENVQVQMGAMQAELMGREVSARRQEIAQALAGRQGMLTVEEQSRLRELDQQLESQQMMLADKAAMGQLALSRENAQQNWNQMGWERGFRDRGWESDLAQQNWQNERDLWY